jgi:predicted RNA binding protein YcfA (HicA-like mRNA interferase family)
MRLVPVSGEELVKILYKKGFIIKRRKGSHVQLEDAEGRRVTVPIHPERVIGRGLLRKILRDAEISIEEYERLRQGNTVT